MKKAWRKQNVLHGPRTTFFSHPIYKPDTKIYSTLPPLGSQSTKPLLKIFPPAFQSIRCTRLSPLRLHDHINRRCSSWFVRLKLSAASRPTRKWEKSPNRLCRWSFRGRTQFEGRQNDDGWCRTCIVVFEMGGDAEQEKEDNGLCCEHGRRISGEACWARYRTGECW